MAMKIAVSAAGPTLEDLIDPRFGRCAFFVIVDPATLESRALANASRDRSGGAGIAAAEQVAAEGVNCVLTGRCGPNAEKVLAAAGIRILDGCTGSVREAVEQFCSTGLAATGGPRVDSAPASPPRSAQSRPQTAAGRPPGFAGRGSGGGMGGGRGMGRGMGGGRGMGRGMGGGRGMGRRGN
jgi:predicted Fe-Mo cluster-binding NifX family protein